MKEVEKDVVTEISMPQVRTLYKYKGQGMGFEKGEVSCIGHRLIYALTCTYLQLFILVSKTNKDWWAVR